jgi:hypothetical protein
LYQDTEEHERRLCHVGQLLDKSWSKTQPTIALSSGEAELAAVVKGATEALGLQAILEDFGIPVNLHLRSDATAAIGMVKREGLGKVRHLATADLWIQQKVRRGHIKVSKVPGKDNPSDMMTKGLEGPDINKHLQTIMAVKASGRHPLAPEID